MNQPFSSLAIEPQKHPRISISLTTLLSPASLCRSEGFNSEIGSERLLVKPFP
jgi:hypothetical protein